MQFCLKFIYVQIDYFLREIERNCKAETTGDACYEAYAKVGLPSGDSFRVIRSIRSGRTEGFAVLEEERQEENMVISPALLNGVFQSVIGILAFDSGRDQMLPFALGRLEIYRAFPPKIRVYLSRKPGTEKMAKFNILVTDKDRKPVCSLEDFTLRATETPQKKNYYTAAWQDAGTVAGREGLRAGSELLVLGADEQLGQALAKAAGNRKIRLAEEGKALRNTDVPQEEYDALVQKLAAGGELPEQILCISRAETHEERMRQGLYAQIRLNRALMAAKPRKPVRILFAYEAGADEMIPEYTGLAGFAKSIRMENPMLCCQVVGIQHTVRPVPAEQLADELLDAFSLPDIPAAVIRDGVIMEQSIAKITEIP